MLTAMSKSEKQVIAWETAREEGPFSCPVCDFPVTLKAGSKKIHHFAHKPGAECEFGSGETEEHMRVKRAIYENLLTTDGCTNWAMERRVFNGVVRPDLSGRINDVPLVIEIQRSNTSVETVMKRFKEYSDRGIAMLWVLTSLPEGGSTILADWKQYLQLIYQGVLYVHEDNLNVRVVKCDYNSRTIKSYETKTVGIVNIAKEFTHYQKPAFSEKSFSFDGGWIWNSNKAAEIIFNEVIENLKERQWDIKDAVKSGNVEAFYHQIGARKEYISTVQLPERQMKQLRNFLSKFDQQYQNYEKAVLAKAKADAEAESLRKAEFEENERLAAIKWEEERPEREARQVQEAEQAAADLLAAQEARRLWFEAPLTELELKEKAERALWRAKQNSMSSRSQKSEQNAQKIDIQPSYSKQIWKEMLDEQNASAANWAKRQAEFKNQTNNNNNNSEEAKTSDIEEM